MSVARLVDRAALEKRARQSLSATPRPFLRWAGSKRGLLPQLVRYLPETYGTYWEPFAGSGSMYLLLEPSSARISDLCHPLIETYVALRRSWRSVAEHLTALPVNREGYYALRDSETLKDTSAGRAARFIYLNKTCWNGLYRVNREGRFNTPYGRPKSSNIFDPVNLQGCARQLRRPNQHLSTRDFEDALTNVAEGDLVFLDPPYFSDVRQFREYTDYSFSWADHCRLASIAKKLSAQGATVLVCGGQNPEFRSLYPAFQEVVVRRHSTLAGEASRRRGVEELLLIGGPHYGGANGGRRA